MISTIRLAGPFKRGEHPHMNDSCELGEVCVSEMLDDSMDHIEKKLKEFDSAMKINRPFGDWGDTRTLVRVNERSWVQIVFNDEYLGRGDSSQWYGVSWCEDDEHGKEDALELLKWMDDTLEAWA